MDYLKKPYLYALLSLQMTALAMQAAPPPPPELVFVWNQAGPQNGDSFDNNAKGYIFQALGLLDKYGRPAKPVGNDMVNKDGKKVGSVIRDSKGNIRGYASVDGKKAAYDVNDPDTTTNYAWLQVDPNGTFHIIKHGANFNPKRGKGVPLGGGVVLDGGQAFPGFGDGCFGDEPGPNWPYYQLTDRSKAKIDVILNVCWSTADVDGDGPYISLAESLKKKVKGVGDVSGHKGVATVQCSSKLVLVGNATNTENQNAIDALDAAAKAANAKDRETWINNLPFDTRYDVANAIIKKEAPGLQLKLTYAKSPEARKMASRGAFSNSSYYACMQSADARGGGVIYDHGESFGRLTLKPGSVPGLRVLSVACLNSHVKAPEGGTVLAQSAVFRFSFSPKQRDQSLKAADLTLGYGQGADVTKLHVYRLAEGGRAWERVTAKPVLDERQRRITVSINEMGTYAAFGPDSGKR